MNRHVRKLLTGTLFALGMWTAGIAASAEPTWGGVYPTIVTPFTGPRGSVHVPALQAQIAHVLQHQINGLVILDRHGEGAFLNWREREVVMAVVQRSTPARVPIVVGIQAANPELAIGQMAQAKQFGARAVLVRYLGDDANEAVHFFTRLASAGQLPIFYDHDAHRLPPRVVARILGLTNVVGLREAQLDLDEAAQHIDVCRQAGKVCLSGTAWSLAAFVDMGGAGVMCPEATLLPGRTLYLHQAAVLGRGRQASLLADDLVQVSALMTGNALTSDSVIRAVQHVLPGNPPPSETQVHGTMKYALTCLGVETPTHVRCQEVCTISSRARRTLLSRLREARAVAPVPYQSPHGQNWGCFLRTGAFQLGPGVSHDLLRSQGDGLWGFPIGE